MSKEENGHHSVMGWGVRADGVRASAVKTAVLTAVPPLPVQGHFCAHLRWVLAVSRLTKVSGGKG